MTLENFEIALGQFIPNHPPKHVFTSTYFLSLLWLIVPVIFTIHAVCGDLIVRSAKVVFFWGDENTVNSKVVFLKGVVAVSGWLLLKSENTSPTHNKILVNFLEISGQYCITHFKTLVFYIHPKNKKSKGFLMFSDVLVIYCQLP